MQTTLEITEHWVAAANNQNAARLLQLSGPDIEIVGPRGSAFGHQILREWLERAGLRLKTERIFARNNTVVLAQHAIWRSAENGKVIGESDVASEFRVEEGKVVKYARYETLEEALKQANLDFSDERLEAE